MDSRDQIDGAEFKTFLRDLIQSGELSGPALAVTTQVIDRGSDSLSRRQREVFEHRVLDIYVYDCRQCGDAPAWTDRIYMRSNGGLCGSCSQRTQTLKQG